MIDLNKESTGFDSVCRKIMNEKEVIYFVEGFMQDKRRGR